MNLASLVAGTVLATALTTSAFGFDPASNAISITFSAKGKTVCQMTLSQPTQMVLVGKATSSCGGNVAGFLLGSGLTEIMVLGTGNGSVEAEFFVEVAKKTFIGVSFNGRTPGSLTGTVTIK